MREFAAGGLRNTLFNTCWSLCLPLPSHSAEAAACSLSLSLRVVSRSLSL